jgi:serine protein kinase
MAHTTDSTKAPGQSPDLLRDIAGTLKGEFAARRSVLSFREYLALIGEKPRQHLRSSAQYVVDTFEYFGSYDRALPTGTIRRFRLFDGAFPEANLKVAGQERVQNKVYQLLKGFARDGRTTKLILLHGPNGSAKTSFIDTVFRGLEHYSRTDDGALYRYSWVFPSALYKKGSIGFGGGTGATVAGLSPDLASYAHLTGDQIEATLAGEMNEHPLMLVPRHLREALLERLKPTLPADFRVPQVLERGELTPRSKAVFDALMFHYAGDFDEVMKHIRVERFTVSKAFRTAAGVIEPQMSVDAQARQITIDKNFQNLPPVLSDLNLFQLSGPIVDANRGVLEFNDLLKRPVDTFKYILSTCETGQLTVDPLALHLDVVFIGSSNATHIDAFKEYADFQSFKGRIELVTVPYLTRVSDEAQIYAQRMAGSERVKPIAPHTFETLAHWTVLTRLFPPQADELPEAVRKMAQSLAPLEKLRLYDGGTAPTRMSSAEAKALRAHVADLNDETGSHTFYEGRVGASPREIYTVLLAALDHPRHKTLSPIAIAEELAKLVTERSVYEFLRIEPKGEYFRHGNFIGVALDIWLDLVDRDVSEALGLMDRDQFALLFKRYLSHVTAWARKQKVVDPVSGDTIPPDEKFMRETERSMLGTGESADDFRQNLMSAIGSFRLDHPDAPMDYDVIFPHLMYRLKTAFYDAQKGDVAKAAKAYLAFVRTPEADRAALDPKQAEGREHTRAALAQRGYDDTTAAEVIAYLLKVRYS